MAKKSKERYKKIKKDPILLDKKRKSSLKHYYKNRTKILENNRKNNKNRLLKYHNLTGLLCNRCNVFIGLAKENINILYSAIKYLEKI